MKYSHLAPCDEFKKSSQRITLAFSKVHMILFQCAIFLLMLSSCASNTVPLTAAVSAIENGNVSDLDDHHQFRLDYFISGKQYSYSTFAIEDKYRYFQLLVEEGEVISVSEIETKFLYWPEIRRCTLFPYHEDFDVRKCLSQFNFLVLQANDQAVINRLSELNEKEKVKQSDQLTGTLVLAAILSPIIVPVAILQSPIMLYDHTSTKDRKKGFQLALGENADLQDYLFSLDPKYVSRNDSSGTAYLESGIFNQPAVAFGFIGNEILWIQKNPSSVCGGGFMFWGMKCTVGKHDDRHW